MKRTLVLSGGGTKGIYQVGVLRALQKLNLDHFDKVIGVSVGSLNAAMIVQNDLDRLEDMYDHLTADQIVNGYVPSEMNLKSIINEREEFLPQLQYYVKEHGIDIHPFYETVDKYYNPCRFFNSDIDFGCIAATKKEHDGVFVTKEMMRENGRDWLVASSSAYPAFPVKEINGEEYVDGGYYDNFPIDYALRDGADQVIGIDMGVQTIHELYEDTGIIDIIHPHYPLYDFLCFDHEKMEKAKKLGYNDAMKYYHKYIGERYTFYLFALPVYFDELEKEYLLMETDIKMATSINERFRSEHVIKDKLMERMGKTHLSSKETFFGVLDALMELCEADDTKVYRIKDARDIILSNFACAAYEEYPYKPSLVPNEFMNYFRELDRKTIVTIFLHSLFYPDHVLIKENILLTVYPFEIALAHFLYIMMKHLR